FEDVRDNVLRFFELRRELGKTQLRTIVQMIVMEETRAEAGAFKAVWERVGADEVLLKNYTVWGSRVVPCCFDFDAVATMGDLRTQTLAEIWDGKPYQELRAAELAGHNDN